MRQAFPPEDPHRPERRFSLYRERPAAVIPFVLLDANGCVVGPRSAAYRPGDCLPARRIADGTAVTVAEQRVGTVIATGNVVIRDPREELFLERISRGLLWGAIAAGLVALALGIGLATTLTRPLRRLTDAIHAMAAGDLEQRVEVHSKDEIGELAGAFNRMSTELTRSNQARRQMTADIAHELRNPLMVITGYIEALRDGVLRPTPARFEMMYEEAQQLQRLVADLRTLSLADAGELHLNREPVNAAALLARVADAYAPAAAQQEIRLLVEPVDRSACSSRPTPSGWCRCWPTCSPMRCVTRLPAGRSAWAPARKQTSVVLTVTDTGEGIPADVLPRIFDRFYRADAARSQSGEESGLGLAIVKSIVTAHGGTVTATSEVGKGTEFVIQLPARVRAFTGRRERTVGRVYFKSGAGTTTDRRLADNNGCKSWQSLCFASVVV